MARPKIDIDLEQVEQLAGLGLTQEEIALSLGISTDTIGRRKKDSADFADAIKRGQANAARAVANRLFDKCLEGDLGAIIWFEKTRRGLSDRIHSEHSGETRIRVEYADTDPDPSETP